MQIIKQRTYDSEEELLNAAKQLEGMRISDISKLVSKLDSTHRKHTKSIVANIIERDYFGIRLNSYEQPDFVELGIELKVSPLKFVESRGLITAKERNVIGMVDYQDVFDNPSWHDNNRLSCKLNRVLFVFYLHERERPAEDWMVLSSFLWSPNNEEDALIQEDYNIIRNKVVQGLPNSEKDNEFLATCPKHGGGYLRRDPLNSKPSSLCSHPVMIKAEKRGFCVRNIPVTELVAKYGLDYKTIKKGRTVGIPPSKFDSLKEGEKPFEC